MIDKYIEKSNLNDFSSGGTNKRCFIFDEYVLLKSNNYYGKYGNTDEKFARDKEKQRTIMKELKENGVNIPLLLEYKRVGSFDYELQERAEGEELYTSNMDRSVEGQKKYLKRLKDIAMQPIEFYDKFIYDWNMILKLGLCIDPSKCSNFFYHNGKISFIDLNVMKDGISSLEKAMEDMYYEMACVLCGGGLLYMCKLVSNESSKLIEIIYKKLGEAIVRANGDVSEYVASVDPTNEYGLSEYINNVVKKNRYQ